MCGCQWMEVRPCARFGIGGAHPHRAAPDMSGGSACRSVDMAVSTRLVLAWPVTWTQLPTPAWSKRAMFGLTSAGSSMWLFGGGMPATNDIWRSTDSG